jgi:hypothetical protein
MSYCGNGLFNMTSIISNAYEEKMELTHYIMGLMGLLGIMLCGYIGEKNILELGLWFS